MKIAYITMTFPVPSETFASNDVRILKEAGMDISVHSLRGPHPRSEELMTERSLQNVPVSHASISTTLTGLALCLVRFSLFVQLLGFILAHVRKPAHVVRSFALVPRALQLYTRLERERPDVVHVYWGHYPSLVAFLVQKNMPEVVTSISLGAYDLEMQYGGTAPVAQRAKMVRTLAQVNVARISEYYGVPEQEITVIHDGVDLQKLRPQGVAPITKTPKRIVTAGRLTIRKGLYDVMDVFSEVVKVHPDASLVILGDGPEREQLEATAAARGISHLVQFRGHVSHDCVFEEMSRAELFLFLSKGRGERLPNVVKEAMITGCVPVASHTTGMEELIPSEQYGFIVPIDGITEATQRVLHLFDHPESIPAIVANGKAFIEERFDIRKSMRSYIRHWRTLTTRTSSHIHPKKELYDAQATRQAIQ